jgi:hypothetical protein
MCLCGWWPALSTCRPCCNTLAMPCACRALGGSVPVDCWFEEITRVDLAGSWSVQFTEAWPTASKEGPPGRDIKLVLTDVENAGAWLLLLLCCVVPAASANSSMVTSCHQCDHILPQHICSVY